MLFNLVLRNEPIGNVIQLGSPGLAKGWQRCEVYLKPKKRNRKFESADDRYQDWDICGVRKKLGTWSVGMRARVRRHATIGRRRRALWRLWVRKGKVDPCRTEADFYFRIGAAD